MEDFDRCMLTRIEPREQDRAIEQLIFAVVKHLKRGLGLGVGRVICDLPLHLFEYSRREVSFDSCLSLTFEKVLVRAADDSIACLSRIATVSLLSRGLPAYGIRQ